MTASPSFKIYADVDGYLDDPVLGPINEMIYDTILDLSEPNATGNRHYPLRNPALAIFKEAYSLMNDLAKDAHPEENFVQKHFFPLRDRLIDTYAAEMALAVVFVLLYLQNTKKSQRLISAIKRAVDVNSGYFKAFMRLATHLEKLGFSVVVDDSSPTDIDWHTKFLKLQEQFQELSALCDSAVITPPVVDKHNQYRLSLFSPEEGVRCGIIQVKELINAAAEAGSTNIFQVLRYLFAKYQGDMVELVKLQEELFNPAALSAFTSNLAVNEDVNKLDLIRIFLAIFYAKIIVSRDNKELTIKEYFETLGKLLDYDFGNVSKTFRNSLQEGCSDETTGAIFKVLSKVIIEQANRKGHKKNRT